MKNRRFAGARWACGVERLAELAPHYGFGFAERKVRPQPAQNAAAYLSSYFVKGKRGKETLWESARSPAMPRSIVHISVKCGFRLSEVEAWIDRRNR